MCSSPGVRCPRRRCICWTRSYNFIYKKVCSPGQLNLCHGLREQQTEDAFVIINYIMMMMMMMLGAATLQQLQWIVKSCSFAIDTQQTTHNKHNKSINHMIVICLKQGTYAILCTGLYGRTDHHQHLPFVCVWFVQRNRIHVYSTKIRNGWALRLLKSVVRFRRPERQLMRIPYIAIYSR